MSFLKGVTLLPSTGEFTYDPTAYKGRRITEASLQAINLYASDGAGDRTDFSIAIDQLHTQFPDCETIGVVVSWFGSSTNASVCSIYPSTTYIGGTFENESGITDFWRCSGLTQMSDGLISLPKSGDSFIYGGTPSDQSIVRCLQNLKTRGYRVVFYPFILMTASGFPWRGRITMDGDDVSAEVNSAISAFLGTAARADFTGDADNLTVSYSGPSTDYTYRRMILHYANLCVLAGGVDLFLLGSELRGLETLRGPSWTKEGASQSDGSVRWDYPFVDSLIALAADVRAIFDDASLPKDKTALKNLISYSGDWSVWMGVQHAGANGQWPHLDQLYADENIDLVCFDNYLPLSDWTTGDNGLDIIHWSDERPDIANWPPSSSHMNGLGLSGQPSLHDIDYLKANIEGGEKFNWFYVNSENGGRGFDPNASDLRISLPIGDRLTQDRQAYYKDQELLANKQIRWWWNNQHKAVYDTSDGNGWIPRGGFTRWQAQSKSIAFIEYGVAACDKATNQPNVFYDPKSSESFTAYWSIWDRASSGYSPRQDYELQLLYLRAMYEYWVDDGKNEISNSGLSMIEPIFMLAWNWDARPFPAFPQRTDLWGDAENWPAGQWVSGKGPFLSPPVAGATPAAGILSNFPNVKGRSWSQHFSPIYSVPACLHASGRQSRIATSSSPNWEIELKYDVLTMDVVQDLQSIFGFFLASVGRFLPFYLEVPAELGMGDKLICRFDEDEEDFEEFMNRVFTLQSLKLVSVPS